MKVAITGTSGLVGKDMWEVLREKQHEVWGLGRRKPDFVPMDHWRTMDVVDPEATGKIVAQVNPDCVIHLAALSNPDDCEKDPVTGYKANALGARNLAIACQRFDTELVYVSTDQVFNGKKGSPYNEMDAPDPVNEYGRSKLWGEQFVQTLLRRFYVVRTALVFGSSRPTFVDRVARCAFSKETLTAAADIVNSPTYSRDLAEAIAYLIGTRLYGVIHVTNEGHCTRLELARFIAESLGRKTAFIKKGDKKKLKLAAPRPGRTPMENFVWNLNGFPKIRHWKDAVLSFLNELEPEAQS